MAPPVDLSENALVVLRSRYLAKDENGRVVETPDEMFRRVARNLVLIDVLYDPEVYDQTGGLGRDSRPGDAAEHESDPVICRTPAPLAAPAAPYTEFDRLTLERAYSDMAQRGHMKVGLDQVLEVLGRRRPDLEQRENELYEAMAGLDLLFNSPTLMNAGRELQQLSACFVLPVEDSLESIFDTIKHTALIHQSGGGTGFSFSRLRPKDDIVKSTGGVASGPVSFMRVFDSATNAIKQGGTRRGANMGILRCDHPDVLEFIDSKTDEAAITNFNISVALTDKFMEAVERDEKYELRSPRTGRPIRSLGAREVFNLVSERAWANGEPGVIFIDRMNEANPTPQIGPIESTNPCGEQPLLPYESCNLASVNLAHMIGGASPGVDFERLGSLVDLAVHYLDNVIDANRYPMPAIERMTKANRKVGLGVMGWADLLIKLGIPYDSEAALSLAEEVMGFVSRRATAASTSLAKERGPFPNYAGSALDRPGSAPVRNATTTTIAPTGTISIIAGASSGIEPLFSIAFTRKGILGGQELVEVNPLFREVAQARGFLTEVLMARLAEVGSIADFEEVPADVRRLFVTAFDIAPEWQIRMQAAFQSHTDNAVSKTVNLPFEATADDIRAIYKMAHKLGCKGVTVYRNGSRDTQVLNVGKSVGGAKAGEVCSPEGLPGGAAVAPAGVGSAASPRVERGPWGAVKPVPRPEGLSGVTVRKVTPLGNLYLTLNVSAGQPFELFAQLGKAGSDVAAFTEGIARLISLALRCGIDPNEVAGELAGIGGNRSVGFGPNRVKSVPDAIARFLDDYLSGNVPVSPWQAKQAGQLIMFENDREAGDSIRPVVRGFDLCPSCGMHSLAYEEGCLKCRSCGYSEC